MLVLVDIVSEASFGRVDMQLTVKHVQHMAAAKQACVTTACITAGRGHHHGAW